MDWAAGIIGLTAPLPFDWEWHSPSLHSASEAEAEAALAVLIRAVAVIVASCLGFAFAGLLHGSLLSRVMRSKRHLFWIVPAINLLLYLVVSQFWSPNTGPLTYPIAGVAFSVFGGLAAALLLLLFMSVRQGFARSELQGGDETLPAMDLEPISADEPPAAAFRRGFLAPRDGVVYLCRHPRLWWFSVLPVVFNLLITTAVLLLLLMAAAGFAVYLHPLFPPGAGWVLLEVLSVLALFLLALGLGLIIWIFLQGVLCGYYYAKLARQVEIHLGTRPEQMQEISWTYQVVDASRDVAALMLINGGFLGAHLVPVVGSAIGVAGSLYFNCIVLGEECFDYPLALRGMRRREKKGFVRKHRFQTLGLGTSVLLANFIPVLGSVLLSAAVVGAVLLHRRLAAASTRVSQLESEE